jgi:hypothetical protein
VNQGDPGQYGHLETKRTRQWYAVADARPETDASSGHVDARLQEPACTGPVTIGCDEVIACSS